MRPVRLHEMIQQRPLTRDQELGCGVIKTGALQLADRRAKFEDFGPQL